ncbi:hypothetical protein C8F04DRAFT_1249749 [Mycena alexandri]|uniref:Glucose receptor Git3 N-terminal domain-containing protein n=1 Tax=Mycena alexandri TaxID=1745969 RepID=A0AAD6XHE5_9AGAR|nr:hypothetical protein C8F04DRAFT_1249749 [Mycena alexandri]
MLLIAETLVICSFLILPSSIHPYLRPHVANDAAAAGRWANDIAGQLHLLGGAWRNSTRWGFLSSVIAVFGLLTAIAPSTLRSTARSHQQHLFLRTHAAAYLISLLICDMIQSVASIMNARWILDMAVETGTLCVIQSPGAMKQISDVGLSFWTFVIALHTFCLVVLGWSGLGILAMTGPAMLDTAHRGPFYGISGYWCWITPDLYVVERATLDYMFVSDVHSGHL